MFEFIKNMLGRNTEELKELVNNGAVIIDVRSVGEFKGGHAPKALNYPLDALDSNFSTIQKIKKPIILCCASGMRSARAKAILKSKGMENLYDAGAWTNLR